MPNLAASQGAQLVNDLLTLSRIGSTGAAHEAIAVRYTRKGNHFIKQDCGFVMAEPTQIHQVAMNLLTNAYHAVEANDGSIKRLNNDYPKVEFSRTGSVRLPILFTIV